MCRGSLRGMRAQSWDASFVPACTYILGSSSPCRGDFHREFILGRGFLLLCEGAAALLLPCHGDAVDPPRL